MNVLTHASLPSSAGRLHPAAGAAARTSGTVLAVGIVENGDARGRDLGYPTANISVPEGEILDGVWAGTVRLGPKGQGEAYSAAVSVGRRPTYYCKGTWLLEAHPLDYQGDLYGQSVLVSLHVYLRTQRRFRGTEDLAAQIRDDVSCVRSWAAGAGREILDVTDRGRETAGARGKHQPPATPRLFRCRPGSGRAPDIRPGNAAGAHRMEPAGQRAGGNPT